MAMLSAMYRVSSRFSLARWILSNRLIRYLHPSDQQLLQMANAPRVPAAKQKEKRERNRRRQPDSAPTFQVPRNSNFVLEACSVRAADLQQLKFYPEYQWLVDFAFCALIVFIFSEAFYQVFWS